MTAARYLLVDRGGAGWAVASAAVRQVRLAGDTIVLDLPGGEVAADHVIGVALLTPRPPGEVLSKKWPFHCAGIALSSRGPVVVVDPQQPPAVLRWRDPEVSDV